MNKIKVNLAKSHGSYIYDDISQKEFFDLHGNFSSMPFGFNPSILDEEFECAVSLAMKHKISNCAFDTQEKENFFNVFKKHAMRPSYKHCFFTTSGALAVELALKTVMWQAQKKVLRVGMFRKQYHGVNGLGAQLTASQVFSSRKKLERLKYYPQTSFKINFLEEDCVEQNVKLYENMDLLLIEPIRASVGDLKINNLEEHMVLASSFGIPIIFDEVQTGAGITGSFWFSDTLTIKPDIICFGKKIQVSGIMVSPKFSDVFQNYETLSSTFDGDIVDMVRATWFIPVISKLCNSGLIKERAELFRNKCGLDKISLLNIGMMFSTNMPKTSDYYFQRKIIPSNCINKNILRFRPRLDITNEEIDDLAQRFS
jgi:L-lysine 6-transaminase